MIPSLDIHGTLPPGDHRATFDEVVRRFGYIGSPRRDKLTRRLEEFYAAVSGIAERIYVDGSYVTGKVSPTDVDLLVILPSGFDFNSAESTELGSAAHDRERLLHVFAYDISIPYHLHLFRKYFRYFTREFPGGRPKGIVYVELNNDQE